MERATQIDALTGLRFFAALWVVLFHTRHLLDPQNSAMVKAVFSPGYLAVGLFFVLSGFVLYHVYHYTDFSQGRSKKQFLLNRIARLYPVYLLSFLADAPRALSYFLSGETPAGALKASAAAGAYLTMTQAWLPRLASAWNPPAWSLSNEFCFYLLFPLLLPVVKKIPRARVVGAALTCYGICLAANGSLGLFAQHSGHPTLWYTYFKFFPFLRLPEFVFGLLLAHGLRVGAIGPPVRPGGATLGFGLGVIAMLVAPQLFPDRIGLQLILHNGVLIPAYALLIWCLLCPKSPSTRALSTPALTLLGGGSYALYLLHMPLLEIAARFASQVGWEKGWGLFSVYLVLSISLSCAVFLGVEQPARKWIRGWG